MKKDERPDFVRKSVLTLSIGILDECEHIFGYLWGNGRPKFDRGRYVGWIDGLTDDELSENQAKFRDMWADFRKYVLDNGNDTIDELTGKLFGIYRTNFKIDRRGNDER